jgi:anti-sigma regulatory factor (Ser/Thr protein kinase)
MTLSTLTLPPQPAAAAALRAWLRPLLAQDGVSESATEEITLAVEEALNGAILYGEQRGADITVTLSTVSADVYLTVSDGAERRDKEPLAGDDEAAETEAFGSILVRGLMDEVTLQSSAEGTIIRLVKHLGSPASGAD